jgi:wyosine [tRNA(Phe)-imidazoG37] synthetase (radical SAM superfamily)
MAGITTLRPLPKNSCSSAIAAQKGAKMKKLIYRIRCAIHRLSENICKRLDVAMLKSLCFKGKAVFGPIHSNRFGYSLCINTLKCKICSYDCVYCQVGQTACLSTCRDSCISAYELFCVVRKKLELLSIQKIPVDYIVFTPQGEPTLDDNLHQKIVLLREFGIKIAVITNASLLWNDKVQEDLLFADYVSLKIDTVNENTWNTLNRPHPRLRFQSILDGIQRFSKTFKGILTTETMIVKNINDNIQEINELGDFLKSIQRKVSFFNTISRPPIKSDAIPPDDHVLAKLSVLITKTIPYSSILFTETEDEFYGAGELEDELIATLSAQPMSEESVQKFAISKGGDKDILEKMMNKKLISRTPYNGMEFFTISTGN